MLFQCADYNQCRMRRSDSNEADLPVISAGEQEHRLDMLIEALREVPRGEWDRRNQSDNWGFLALANKFRHVIT